MQLVFVDDSRQPQPVRRHLGDLVSIGAVIFPEESVAPYAQDLAHIRSDLGVPENEELKWKPDKGTFLASVGGPKVTELRQRMLKAAAAHDVRSAVVIWDRGTLAWDRESAASTILGYLYDRIEIHLAGLGERGVVIADIPGGGPRQNTKWLADSLDLTTAGTRYVKPERVVMPIVTTPSHHVPHIQLADLVVAATTAAVAGIPSGMGLVNLLKPLARQNPRGYVGGAGLVLWPPELHDLYYWVLEEDVHVRGNTEHPIGPDDLPFAPPARPFKNNSGLPD